MKQKEDHLLSSTKVWYACGYVRLSHEDGNGEESNSVTEQKELICDYFQHHPEMILCDIKVDDGFSGSSFERPAFQDMIAEIKSGKINCIVVKDLSRFGRNYLDVGEYIERIFPFLGVRFIAIQDHYDSLHSHAGYDEWMIPFKNLINEAYCRDTSIKIRSQLAIKRRRGDFISSFAAYGYWKDPENKNHLVVDEFAANVVRDIYRWKLEGISARDIAESLNRDGILAPMDYKKSQGLRFATPFRIHDHSAWNTTTILRILKNPIYIGVLEQGKNTTPSYKVKRRIEKSREEWDIVEGTHEAVIDPYDFELVQKVLMQDTRKSPGSRSVELFSGIVYCGECKAAMVRKTVPSGKKNYIYYVCAAHKKEKTCDSHSLRDNALEEIVLELVKRQVQAILGKEGLRKIRKIAAWQKAGVKKQQERLDKKQEEITRYQRLLDSLYENWMDGIIDREEYETLKKNYTVFLAKAKEQAKEIHRKISYIMENEMGNEMENKGYRKQFGMDQGISELDRTIVVCLIEKILIYRDKQVEVVFHWKNEYQGLATLSLQMQKERGVKREKDII